MKKKPDDIKTSIYQFLMGAGGYSVVVRGIWYHYHRGRFTKHPVATLAKLPGFLVTQTRRATDGDVAYLERLLGSKWTIRRNCVTKLKDL